MPLVYTPDTLSTLESSPPLYGVIGYPVTHSLSPAMQQAAFDACGLAARYVLVEVPRSSLPETIIAMRDLPFAGWNCTIPHKLELAERVDELDESACQLGGVNTVANNKGHLKGYNTDGEGWVRAIKDDFGLEVRDLRILVLGTGGAGMAIARQAAIEKCPELVLVNRTKKTADDLAGSIKAKGLGQKPIVIDWDNNILSEALKNIDLIVNTTSVGLKETDPAVLPWEIIHPHLHVYDTIYKPTRLLASAKEKGARTANGLSMLLHQGALAFEIWTGRPAPLEIMKSALWKAAYPTSNS